MPTLYETIGGEPGVTRLVDEFYNRILADPELAPFFVHSAEGRLRNMQQSFIAAALGGPVEYGGRPLSEVHRGRGISRRHIQRFIQHLLDTLRGFDITPEDAQAIAARVNLYADEVTGDFDAENP